MNSLKLNKALKNTVESLNGEFPPAEIMSRLARVIYEDIFGNTEDVLKNPGEMLIYWIDVEYKLFCAIEEKKYGKKIRLGFKNMEEFVEIANSILNRRKSRAGKSLEEHLAKIFEYYELPFERQVVTEANKKPDFIFPSGNAYHNPNYDSSKIIVLAAKTTCKDRWRQILNEANRMRDKNKYLFTLQQGISYKQFMEMKSERVKLIVPEPYIETYAEEFRDEILTLSDFIELVRKILY